MTTVTSHGDVQCIACDNWNPRETPIADARLGYAYCKVIRPHAGKYVTAHFTRQCDKFRQAGAEIVEAREQWLTRSSK